MTGRAHLLTSTARLVDGAGLCTVALRGTRRPEDAATAYSHERDGDRLLVRVLPAAGSGFPAATGAEVVVVIDEYAPVLESRIHVGSVHVRGVVDTVDVLMEGGVALTIRPGDFAVSRLGGSAVVTADELRDATVDPLSDEVFQVAGEVLARYARGVAAVSGHVASAAPTVLGVDSAGLDVLAQTPMGARVSRLDFRSPATAVDDAVREVARLVGAAA